MNSVRLLFSKINLFSFSANLFACSFLCLAPEVVYGEGKGSDPEKLQSLYEKEGFGALLDYLREEKEIPSLAVAVVCCEKISALGVSGTRRMRKKNPVTQEDLYLVGSVSKPMTSTLIAHLVENKKLSYEASFKQLFPELATKMPEAFGAITVEQLLMHRSGLSRNAGDRYNLTEFDTPEDGRYKVLLRAMKEPLEVDSGKQYLYSNSGYDLLGAVIDRVAGEPYEDFIQKTLFDPLKMNRAGFGTPQKNSKDLTQPWGHAFRMRFWYRSIKPGKNELPRFSSASGFVHCSIKDFAKYAQFQLKGFGEGNSILSKKSFEKLYSNPENLEYGYGWSIGNYGDVWPVSHWHGGGTNSGFFKYVRLVSKI